MLAEPEFLSTGIVRAPERAPSFVQVFLILAHSHIYTSYLIIYSYQLSLDISVSPHLIGGTAVTNPEEAGKRYSVGTI